MQRIQLPQPATAKELATMMSQGPIRILSVEDHPVFREGLSTIIGSQPDMLLVSQAANTVEAVAEFSQHRPDMALMGLRLPGHERHSYIDRNSEGVSSNPTIMLTTSDGRWEHSRRAASGRRCLSAEEYAEERTAGEFAAFRPDANTFLQK